MKKYSYSASSNTIWASFDYGEVDAENEDEALIIAKEKIKTELKKINKVLSVIGQSVEINLDNIEILPCEE